MTVPGYFRNQGERNIISYDWIDIASGTGYVEFQGYASTTSTGTTYHLTDNPIYSSPDGKIAAGSTTNVEFNFDSDAFKRPNKIEGLMHFFFTTNTAGNGGGDGTIQVTIEAMHLRGAVETSLGSVTDVAHIGGGDAGAKIVSIDITRTHFKIGDKLRLEVTLTLVTTVGGAWDYAFMHDPLNRDMTFRSIAITAATTPTYFKVLVPFRVNS